MAERCAAPHAASLPACTLATVRLLLWAAAVGLLPRAAAVGSPL